MRAVLESLCQRCGLCCDGSLFTQVPLVGAEEVAAVRRRGLVVLTRADGSAALPQPCAALAGRRCTVYEERPESCRRYRCMLYAALAEDEVAPAEALATVEQAQALIAAVAEALPPGPGAPLQRARRAAAADELAPETAEALRRALAFVERRFRGHGGR